MKAIEALRNSLESICADSLAVEFWSPLHDRLQPNARLLAAPLLAQINETIQETLTSDYPPNLKEWISKIRLSLGDLVDQIARVHKSGNEAHRVHVQIQVGVTSDAVRRAIRQLDEIQLAKSAA